MADQTISIIGGPSRYEIQAAVFDIEHFRLVAFKFKMNGKKGFAKVMISGATQGNREIEEWRLSWYFLPNGEETVKARMVPMSLTYSSWARQGIIFAVDSKTLTGNHATPNVVDLITWEP